MKNEEVADIFRSIAQILEIQEENVFKIRAYNRAAETVRNCENLEEMVHADTLTELAGIGKDLAAKIKEYFSTGSIEHFEKLKKEVPQGVLELLSIPTIGPKTVKLLYKKLRIRDIDELEKKARDGSLLGVERIKEKTVQNILKGIEIVRKGKQRFDIASAWEIASYYAHELERLPGVKKVSVAGSLRRMKETAKDIDILVVSKKASAVMDALCRLDRVKEVLAKGETKTSVISREGIQVDVRVVDLECFGAALLYFTGSKNHNVRIRTIAVRKNLKINEYGIFKGKKLLASKTEEVLYKKIGMQYVEPEMREDVGEVELALKNELPVLVEQKDILGDFHVHSNYSDGRSSIEEMAQAAKKMGYRYLVITDHSQSLKVAGGLDEGALRKKKKEIDALNKKEKALRILFGTEVEIDSEGAIDYDTEILEGFDFVIASIHTGLKQPKEQITRRLIRACEHPCVDVIAHPTGKLRGVRDSYEIDFEAFFAAASHTKTVLEINAFPDRLDLGDSLVRLAKTKGVKFAIGTDSHQFSHLSFMRYGVALARRAGLGREDVLNTLAFSEVVKSGKRPWRRKE